MFSYRKQSQSRFVAGILFVTCISWLRNAAIVIFNVATIQPVNNLWFVPHLHYLKPGIEALTTVVFIDFLSSSGTLAGITTKMVLIDKSAEFHKNRMSFGAHLLSSLAAAAPVIFLLNCWNLFEAPYFYMSCFLVSLMVSPAIDAF